MIQTISAFVDTLPSDPCKFQVPCLGVPAHLITDDPSNPSWTNKWVERAVKVEPDKTIRRWRVWRPSVTRIAWRGSGRIKDCDCVRVRLFIGRVNCFISYVLLWVILSACWFVEDISIPHCPWKPRYINVERPISSRSMEPKPATGKRLKKELVWLQRYGTLPIL